jgi:predicted enzyme related to lactoylglutathione lyase
MSERSEYSPGEFCWVDLGSPDLEASASFYGDLLGWERDELGPVEETRGYSNFLFKGKAVAGLGPIMGEGQPPAWNSYIRVDDADETAGKIRDASGSVMMGPFDLPGGAGRMAVCHDPEGAFFMLWQPKAFAGAQLVNEVGCWNWSNLLSRDLDKARDFYGRVFGWTSSQNKEAPPGILNWQLDGQRWPEGLGGLMAMGDVMPAEVPPHWQVYFGVESAGGAIETTKSAGGTLLFGPQAIPVGVLAVLTDPQGAAFAIIEPDYPEAR